MVKGFRPHGLIAAVAAALALAACGAPPVRHTAAAPAVTAAATATATATAGAGSYRIDTARSELRILVYRAGPLARWGHNHVMVNRSISGSVEWGGEASPSAFELTMSSAAFSVDDPTARLEEGDVFAADIPDDARAGTLRNMLSAAVLDADEFPVVSVRSVAASAGPAGERAGAWNGTVAIHIAGHDSTVVVPFTLTSESGRLCATGSTELRQSALGLRPFSIMLGALQVQDELTVKFRIVADRGARD